jgi:protein-tyrosine phosphatase
MDEIIRGLYVGNASIATKALNSFNLIVNCTKNIPDSIVDPFVEGPIGEDSNDELLLYLPEVTREVHDILSSNGTVLIHCAAGASRSPSVVAGYLIAYREYTLDDAILFIRSKRKQAFYDGNVVFRKALTQFSLKK